MLLLQTVLSLQRAHADRVKRRRERGENTIHTNEEKRKVARCINFSQRRISGPDLAGPDDLNNSSDHDGRAESASAC